MEKGCPKAMAFLCWCHFLPLEFLPCDLQGTDFSQESSRAKEAKSEARMHHSCPSNLLSHCSPTLMPTRNTAVAVAVYPHLWNINRRDSALPACAMGSASCTVDTQGRVLALSAEPRFPTGPTACANSAHHPHSLSSLCQGFHPHLGTHYTFKLHGTTGKPYSDLLQTFYIISFSTARTWLKFGNITKIRIDLVTRSKYKVSEGKWHRLCRSECVIAQQLTRHLQAAASFLTGHMSEVHPHHKARRNIFLSSLPRCSSGQLEHPPATLLNTTPLHNHFLFFQTRGKTEMIYKLHLKYSNLKYENKYTTGRPK